MSRMIVNLLVLYMHTSITTTLLIASVSLSMSVSVSATSIRAVGGVFCEANSARGAKLKCLPQKCEWDNWYHKHYEKPDDEPVTRVVLSYGHCGFGNQIFQHNFAQMTAEQTDSAFFASKIPNAYVTGGLHWAESKAGYNNAKPMINPKLLWENLPSNHSAKVLCARNNVTVGYRPVDRRTKRPEWNTNFMQFFDPDGPKCLVLLGFFQEYIPCLKMRQNMWRGVYENQRYDTFGPSDMVVHMRCLGGHYPPPNKLYIEAVLNNTKYDKLYIFKPPGPCRNRGKGTKYDNTYIIDMLVKRYGAQYYSRPNATGLTDFLDLSSAYQVIETASTYSFWSGMFSNQNATIHVDTSFHRVVPDDHRFVYHDPWQKKFYGTYSIRDKKIKYKFSGTEFIRELVQSSKNENILLRNQTIMGRLNRTVSKRGGNRNTTSSVRLAQLGGDVDITDTHSEVERMRRYF